MKTSASSSQMRFKICASKLGEVPELLEALVDVFAGERAETIHPEFFAAEAAHHGPIDHGAADLLGAPLAGLEIHALFGQIADEAAGAAVTCARGIENLFEQIG